MSAAVFLPGRAPALTASFASAPSLCVRPPLSRRQFLRGTGVALALPWLDAMLPAAARAGTPAAKPAARPRRLLGICNNLGLLPEFFFPQGKGASYVASQYLERLAAQRDDFTVFSGVSHPGVDGGHPSDVCFLTAAPHPGTSGFRNTLSLDQYIGERIGHLTRFPSLTLGVNVKQGVRSLSWTASGVMIPCEERPSEVFNRLFLQGSPAEVAEQMRQLDRGRSILDAVQAQARTMERRLGADDRARLDQYFTSIRDLEQRMQMSRGWEQKPKPAVYAAAPKDAESPREYMEKVKAMYDLARLAFATDSTRSIALLLDSVNSPAIELEGAATSDGYHNLSHHGKSEAKIAELKTIDAWQMKLLGQLIADLKAMPEEGGTLLDSTMVLYGSNLGNANMHTNTNLPLIFAGGGFRHGRHLAFDRRGDYPLANLFVSVLQRMGIETDRFASATGTMDGLSVEPG